MKQWEILKSYVQKYTSLFLLSAVLTVMEVVIGIMHPKLVEQIIDIGIQKNDLSYITRVGTLMLILCVLGCITGVAATILSGQMAAQVGHSLRMDLFSRIVRADIRQSDTISKSALFARISGDCHSVMDFLAELMHTVLKPVVLFVSGLVMLFLSNPVFGLVMVAAVSVEFVFMILLYRRTNVVFHSISLKIDGLIKILRQNIVGARLVRIFSREEKEQIRFDEANHTIRMESGDVFKISATMNARIMLVMNSVTLVLLLLGGAQAQGKSVQVGQILAAVAYSQQVMMSVMSMGLLFRTLAETRVALDRITQVLQFSESQPEPLPDFDGQIREVTFDRATFCYEDKVYLEDVSFTVKAGEKIAVLGETASGKTLLVHLLTGIYPLTSGRILINGRDMSLFSPESVRERIAVAQQDNALFSGTLEENILWGREGSPDEASGKAQAEPFIRQLRRGYQSRLYDKGQNLSGGQRQRLQLARALHGSADVLVIDDAVSQIDAVTKQKILSAIDAEGGDRITILTSQRHAPYLERCDKVILLRSGRIEDMGTHVELLERCSLYQTFCSLQNGGAQ